MSTSESNPHTSAVRVLPHVVLVVDDDHATRHLVVRWLTSVQTVCLEASNGEEALRQLATGAPVEVIVLDVMMPELDGFGVVRTLKDRGLIPGIGVILLTAHALTEEDVLRGLEHGVMDHMAKPFSGAVLKAKVLAACARVRHERELKKRLALAEHAATVDALTQLGNRRAFKARLREEAAYARRHKLPLSAIVLDIDHFKRVNDTYGHDAGDRVLAHFAELLRNAIRGEDAAFRYGGEEFVLLLRGVAAQGAEAVAQRLRVALADSPIDLGDPPVATTIRFSAGIACTDEASGFAVRDLVAQADEALYAAKRSGRDRTVIAARSVPADEAESPDGRGRG